LENFSILTGLYNSNIFLDNYFKTIFNQIILPNEIILIDDGNNYNLDEIIYNKKKQYDFKNIVIIKNINNIGLGPSLNLGLKISSNKLVFRLDADDEWLKNHTQKMLNSYNQDKNNVIYAESLKYNNLRNIIKCDNFLINENSTVHSSWLINKNVCPDFRYHVVNPKIALEDYFTLFWHKYHGYKINISYHQITTLYKDTPNSLGKKYANSIHYLRNRKKLSKFFFNLELKKRNIFSKLYLILFEMNLIRTIVYLFWIQDIIKIKYFFIKLKSLKKTTFNYFSS
jgi:glycosyltransferase involved in cell wall biosynthesis